MLELVEYFKKLGVSISNYSESERNFFGIFTNTKPQIICTISENFIRIQWNVQLDTTDKIRHTLKEIKLRKLLLEVGLLIYSCHIYGLNEIKGEIILKFDNNNNLSFAILSNSFIIYWG